ncbi:hypothetical protein BZL39_I03760 [Zygosaccharomyces parabailii]|nr:hypothetical protein BZL39_I03760 [Zygosaccharomyces parabailii]CDH11416.1 uncharacterized protein ZBAI_03202 [Zygosaccharomyces bailii ISA1307]
MQYQIKRLTPEDAEQYHQIRLEGFRLQYREFRYSPEDEMSLPPGAIATRLQRDFVVRAYMQDELIGIGGITRCAGFKLNHRAILWRMYVRPNYRRKGVANVVMDELLTYAHERNIERIILTVVSENVKAINFYKHYGFIPYGVDASAIKLRGGTYLDEVLMAHSLLPKKRQ